jgi:hypothetical protein|tara:strand:+ start:258 stop:437 length:180 start_codon:yes stop_codon:yes gene_type:complete
MLTRKDFIKKANEFVKLIKENKDLTYSNKIIEYIEIAEKSNKRFDSIRFRDHIEKGLYE